MKKFLKEFKEFAVSGDILNLAIGIIIGAAFQSVVASLTANILSPIIGLFTKQNFDTLQLQIGEVTLGYGMFITSLINFLIMAFVVFMLVKLIAKLKTIGAKPQPKAAPTTKTCPHCASEISIKATKCPFCTSALEVEETEPEEDRSKIAAATNAAEA